MLALELDSSSCQNLDLSLDREWIETNGLGGFASGTVAGANTRRYHGLLVAAAPAPVERFVMLSKLDETVKFAGVSYPLSTNIFPGAVSPAGYSKIRSFKRGLFPVWEYELPAVTLKKTIAMLHGENSVVVIYEVLNADAPFVLELRPFVAARHYHSLGKRNDAFSTSATYAGKVLSMHPYPGLPPLKINVPGGSFQSAPDWYYNFEYPVERSRGFDSSEDLFTPGLFEVSLKKGSVLAVIASAEPAAFKEGKTAIAKEEQRRQKLSAGLPRRDDLSETLAFAADQFLVRRGRDGLTVMAGYPWFTDWGRDTMISLPGLALVTGRHGDALKILRTFFDSISEGMIPNLFPDGDKPPLFNTVDATLWMFIAVHSYNRYAKDKKFIRDEALPALRQVLEWHSKGTRYSIKEDSDGLLQAGDASVQLTWMDAKIGNWVVTPRSGKPVEIQALWYAAHRIAGEFHQLCGEDREAALMAKKAAYIAESFSRQFWNPAAGYFYDCIENGRKDDALRPNQIFALSLPFQSATTEQAISVLQHVRAKLYTPVGLRTLSPDHPAYRGRYAGGPVERDSSYHQGTVWAWLLGPYITALCRYGGLAGKAEARKAIDGIRLHLGQACMGSISEIFDGDAPFAAKGAFAQAWSVAEVLRAYVEDVG